MRGDYPSSEKENDRLTEANLATRVQRKMALEVSYEETRVNRIREGRATEENQ